MHVSQNTDSPKRARSRDTQAADTCLLATKSTPVYNTLKEFGMKILKQTHDQLASIETNGPYH